MMDNDFYVSTDNGLLDIDFIHRFLTEESHWGRDKTVDEVLRNVEDSLCFGLYDLAHTQVGFGRVVTDFRGSAYIMDVFIGKSQRGKGLGKMLMEYILKCPELGLVLNWELKSRDAQGFYEKLGFLRVPGTERSMVRQQGSTL
jgi:GNAT superfamily N-acetyltransferase